MKKNVLTMAMTIIALIGFGSSVKAQTIKTVTVNLELKDVIGFNQTRTGPGSNVVDLIYENADQYKDGFSTTSMDMLNVTSSTPFSVLVRGVGPFTGKNSSANSIPLSQLQVFLNQSSSTNLQGTVSSLSTTNQVLLANAPASIEESFNLSFQINDSKSLLLAPKDKYSTDVVFSLSAQ